jgi:hypothetical protein
MVGTGGRRWAIAGEGISLQLPLGLGILKLSAKCCISYMLGFGGRSTALEHGRAEAFDHGFQGPEYSSLGKGAQSFIPTLGDLAGVWWKNLCQHF